MLSEHLQACAEKVKIDSKCLELGSMVICVQSMEKRGPFVDRLIVEVKHRLLSSYGDAIAISTHVVAEIQLKF